MSKHRRSTRKRSNSTPVAHAEILCALNALCATRDGFEGLTAALIDAATGGALRLLASGDQRGVDAIADPAGIGPRRAMQSKRYGPSTSLSRTGLLGEMAAAHEAWPGIDCWVLASTKALQGVTARSAHALAQAHGWGFVALDWSPIAPGFPRLATACAAFVDIACGFDPIAEIRVALEELATKPGFAAARDALIRELCAADVGFHAARDAACAELDRIFSDPATARSIAGPSPAFLAEAPPVPRMDLRSAITDWWATDASAAVLLGTEGMGKTWSALDAVRHLAQENMRHLAQENKGPLPIVIGSAAWQRS